MRTVAEVDLTDIPFGVARDLPKDLEPSGPLIMPIGRASSVESTGKGAGAQAVRRRTLGDADRAILIDRLKELAFQGKFELDPRGSSVVFDDQIESLRAGLVGRATPGVREHLSALFGKELLLSPANPGLGRTNDGGFYVSFPESFAFLLKRLEGGDEALGALVGDGRLEFLAGMREAARTRVRPGEDLAIQLTRIGSDDPIERRALARATIREVKALLDELFLDPFDRGQASRRLSFLNGAGRGIEADALSWLNNGKSNPGASARELDLPKTLQWIEEGVLRGGLSNPAPYSAEAAIRAIVQAAIARQAAWQNPKIAPDALARGVAAIQLGSTDEPSLNGARGAGDVIAAPAAEAFRIARGITWKESPLEWVEDLYRQKAEELGRAPHFVELGSLLARVYLAGAAT